MQRFIIIVLDSVGIGELPDAPEFFDSGAHTLGNVFANGGDVKIPNLISMGLGNIIDSRVPSTKSPLAAFGRMMTKTYAKDTTSGHWELMGLIMDPPFRTFTNFPDTMLTKWLTQAGRPAEWLGNCAASGTAIIDELGESHIQTGWPIVYTSADSVFQVAAHEDVIPLGELYALCEAARELLVRDLLVSRVIARPFLGSPGGFFRTKNRRDFQYPPPWSTLLDTLERRGQTTMGIGKIEDIFCRRGIKRINHTTDNAAGIFATIDAIRKNTDDTIIFTNLVDFDMLYGHRNDTQGYARALEAFDSKLQDVLDALRPQDVLIITADHGCDPTTRSTDHTREYVPLLVYGIEPRDLGTRKTLADVAASIYAALGHGEFHIGESFM